MKRSVRLLAILCLLFLFFFKNATAQTTVKRVILEAFWWDYWNSNYPNGWANYLTELAPRLKAFGIDAVWIPPSSKGGNGTGDVGYGIYDHYDLGDKFQKGNVRTRLGTKDELLRMVAVMHANGIEVIQDLVPNHVNGAGDTTTNAGIDPDAWDNKYKLFRYPSYATPLTNGTIAEYRLKQGRFPKNWQNFHPNPNDNCNSGDICSEYFGPDISYVDGSNGQTLLSPAYDPDQITYNPAGTGGTTGTSGNGYMRRHYREWAVWDKKQIGFDGVRLDAAKNYQVEAAEDFLYNLQQGSGFANGGNRMFAVGEYVDGKAQIDNWENAVNKRAGTFDFDLRAAIKSMVDGNGSGYDMSNLVGTQQNIRVNYVSADNTYFNITVPFVNNHDTFRPCLDANGNYIGWQDGTNCSASCLSGGNCVRNELADHIDPFNVRMPLAYAAELALDGNPQIFFEDLFNIGGTGKRFTHIPTSTTDLPQRAPLENIIWCHQNLDFKDGAYKVRSTAAGGNVYFNSGSSAADLLIIERSNKAVIGLNDRGDAGGWQSAYVDTDFPQGTVLKDYSGANGTATVTVPADKRVLINVPPVDAANNRWGYAVWAPVGITGGYVPPRATTTTQEWEMADDLGDSHCSSLMQGGALPLNSTNQRVAGKIFAAANQVITIKIYPQVDGANVTSWISDLSGNILAINSGVTTVAAPLTLNYTSATDGWLVVKIRNTTNVQASQKLYCNVTYTAPQVVNTLSIVNAVTTKLSIWTGNKNSSDITDCGNWEEGKLPSATTDVLIPAYASPSPVFNTDIAIGNITIENGASMQVLSGKTLSVNGNWFNNNLLPLSICGKVSFVGTAMQQLTGQNTFCALEINNAANVNAQNNNEVVNQLILTNGKYLLNNFNLTLQSSCSISGGNTTNFVQSLNAAAGGFLIQEINASPKNFPIGNSDYTPVTITNNGTIQNCKVRCFENVLQNGLSGAPVSSTEKIKKTWEITPLNTGAVADIILNWNTANNDATFISTYCFAAKNKGGAGANWQQISTQGPAVVIGANTFSKSASGVNSFSKFTIFSNTAVLPIRIISFSAVAVQNIVMLKWSLADENEVTKYAIERSVDGINYLPIVQMPKGQLTFTDHDFIQNGWYRLSVTDLSGKKIYSDIVFVKKMGQTEKFYISPNPVRSFVNINSEGMAANESVIMQLINTSAIQLMKSSGNLKDIENSINQKIGLLPAGIYFIKLYTATSTNIFKILKQ